EHVKKWFTPAPWKTVDCEIDLRPGGIFRTVMRSPDGKDITNVGCFLEIVANRKLVWTVALAPGYRPSNPTFDVPAFTASIMMEPEGNGTKYTALESQYARSHGFQRGLEQGARSARRRGENDVDRAIGDPIEEASMNEPLVVRRETHIAAPPATVFAFLTDPEKIVRWMGAEATTETHPGGLYLLKGFGGDHARVARGAFREVVPVHRLVYTFGWEASQEVPPGSSLVEIDLIERDGGTLLRMTHSGLPNEAQCAG